MSRTFCLGPGFDFMTKTINICAAVGEIGTNAVLYQIE